MAQVLLVDTLVSTAGNRRNLCVLVAEDDGAMRELIAFELRRDGCDVREATSGRDLIAHVQALIQNNRPPCIDLIIADVRMPGAGGIEVLEALRAVARPPPVILITAFGDAEIHARAMRLGAAAFFDKPFDLSVLRAAVRNLASHNTPRS